MAWTPAKPASLKAHTTGQTFELDPVEMFATGIYPDENGEPRTWKMSDLKEIVANFDKLKKAGLLKPPVVIGHEENQEWLDKTDLPAAGWPDKVWIEGDKLLGHFAEIPPQVAERLRNKEFRKVSVEIYPDFVDDFGNKHGQALRRVALLGGEIPQVKRLADLPMPKRKIDSLATPVVISSASTFACRFSKRRQTFLTFGELKIMDRQAAIDALMAALQAPDSITDEQLAAMQAAMAPVAPMAERGDVLGELTAMGQDPTALESMTDEELNALLAKLKGAAMSEPTPSRPTPAPAPSPTTRTIKETFSPAATAFSEAQKAMAAAAALNKQIAEAKAKFDRDQAEQKTAAKLQAVSMFVESKVALGIITKADAPAHVSDLMHADDQKVLTFGEGTSAVKLTAFEKKKADLDARQPLAFFGERIPASANLAGEEENKIKHWAQKNADALKSTGKTLTQLLHTFSERRKTRPDFTAADLLGKGQV